MDQIFGIGRYQNKTISNKNLGFQNGGFPQTRPSKIQTF